MIAKPIAALEIGTSRTVVAVAEPLAGGRVRILAHADIPSTGVRKSQIVDISQARYSVDSVLKALEDKSGYGIGAAWLVVSGPHVRAQGMPEQLAVPGGIVREEDIAEIDNRLFETPLPPGRTPLELSPICYGLDDEDNILSPKGLSGHVLKERALYIHGDEKRIADARNAAREARLEIPPNGLGFAGTCAAAAVLTPQQKRDGALVIDLGGGSTAFTVWTQGRLVQAGVVGVGSDHVTNDIQIAFSISHAQAEQFKCDASSAIVRAEDADARLPVPASMPGFQSATISRRALNTVVNARLQELFTIIRSKLDEENNLNALNAGVFLTGGGAAQRDVVQLAATVFGRAVRVATLLPEIEWAANCEHPASYAAVAGLILLAGEDDRPTTVSDRLRHFFGRIF